jgi:hypothetical protein
MVGMPGCGKTSFVKKKLLKATDQVAIYDPNENITACWQAENHTRDQNSVSP